MDKIEEIRKKLIRRTRKKVKEKFSGKEIGAIKASNLLDDLDSAYNLLAEQTIDWYSFHFPELLRLSNDSETALKLIAHLGDRKNFNEKNILAHYSNENKAKTITKIAKKSLGVDLEIKEMDEIKLLAINTLNLKEEKKFLTKFLDEKMNLLAPNFSALCGSILGAKFVAKTGSLKKLAMLPSSTIQVMGAEKALFAHLKTGSNPPKHGFLYSHPMVKKVRPKIKGKVARKLAAKLSIAIKEDYFGNTKIFPELIRELEKKVQQLDVKKN